jgi:hypothetical protein
MTVLFVHGCDVSCVCYETEIEPYETAKLKMWGGSNGICVVCSLSHHFFRQRSKCGTKNGIIAAALLLFCPITNATASPPAGNIIHAQPVREIAAFHILFHPGPTQTAALTLATVVSLGSVAIVQDADRRSEKQKRSHGRLPASFPWSTGRADMSDGVGGSKRLEWLPAVPLQVNKDEEYK